MSLHTLPNEIIVQIAQSLPSERDLYYFGRVCRRLYRPVNLVLYRRNQVSGKALYWGAVKNIPTVIQHAVDAGTCITDTDWPLLSYAASLGHVRALEALLKHGEIASFVWEVNESTPLLDGIRGNNTEVVKLLLDHGADPLEPLESRFRHGETPLHYAAEWPNTNPEIVAMLIKAANGNAPHHPRHGTLLHVAAYHGHTKMAEILLDGCADHMLPDPGNSTPLGLSVSGGHIETAKFLLARFPSVCGHLSWGEPLLLHVAGSCKTDMAMLLLEHGANPHDQSDAGARPLHRAAMSGNNGVVRILLEHGAHVDAQCSDGRTALHEAVLKSRADTVKILLRAGANTLLRTSCGRQPLHLVQGESASEIVDVLLDHGAAIDALDAAGWSPLAVVVKHSHYEAVRRLIERGASLRSMVSSSSLLSVAADNNNMEIVSFLCARGSDLAWVDDVGRTALHTAVRRGHTEVIRLLLDHGADCQALDSYGRTPVLLASANGHTEIVALLIQHGADIEQANTSKYTPLLIASEKGHLGVVELLLANNANVLATNSTGWGPAMAAAVRGRAKVLDRLLQTGRINIDKQDIHGRTALFLAVMRRSEAAVKVLLSQAPHPACDIKDRYGATPLIMAARHGHVGIITALLGFCKQPVHVRDAFGHSAIYWASRSGKSQATALLASVMEAEGSKSEEVEQTVVKSRFRASACYCDVCGRCAIDAIRNAAQVCNVCKVGDDSSFLICSLCVDNGATCCSSDHTWAPHECDCDTGTDDEEDESDEENESDEEDESNNEDESDEKPESDERDEEAEI